MGVQGMEKAKTDVVSKSKSCKLMERQKWQTGALNFILFMHFYFVYTTTKRACNRFRFGYKNVFWLFSFDFWRAACLEYLILVFKLTSLGPQQVEFDIPLILLS